MGCRTTAPSVIESRIGTRTSSKTCSVQSGSPSSRTPVTGAGCSEFLEFETGWLEQPISRRDDTKRNPDFILESLDTQLHFLCKKLELPIRPKTTFSWVASDLPFRKVRRKSRAPRLFRG